MTFRFILSGAAGAALLFAAGMRGDGARAQQPPRAAAHPGTDTVPLYTEEQLTSGTALYAKVCADCHQDGDYTSAKFRDKWNGKPLLELYEAVRTKMPDDRPGTLTRDEYAQALAYVLKLNGVPAGQAKVMPDSAAMGAVTLSFPPAGAP